MAGAAPRGLFGAQLHLGGQPGDEVAPAHAEGHLVGERQRRADRELDRFGGARADDQLVRAADLCALASSISSASTGSERGTTTWAEREHRDLGGAITGVGERPPIAPRSSGSDGRRDCLPDELHGAGAGWRRASMSFGPPGPFANRYIVEYKLIGPQRLALAMREPLYFVLAKGDRR